MVQTTKTEMAFGTVVKMQCGVPVFHVEMSWFECYLGFLLMPTLTRGTWFEFFPLHSLCGRPTAFSQIGNSALAQTDPILTQSWPNPGPCRHFKTEMTERRWSLSVCLSLCVCISLSLPFSPSSFPLPLLFPLSFCTSLPSQLFPLTFQKIKLISYIFRKHSTVQI